MNHNRNWIKYVFIFLVFLIGCAQKGEIVLPRQYANTPQGNFDAFWNGIDQNYVFFEETKVNWNEVYDLYAPQINSRTTKTQLFEIFRNMMRNLVDGHRVLKAEPDARVNFNGGEIGAGEGIGAKYPAFDVYTNAQALTSFIDKYLSLGTALVNTKPDEETKQPEPEIYYGFVNQNTLYVKLFSFGNALSEYKQSKTDTSVSNFINVLKVTAESGKNLILDLRFNGGGNAREFYEIGSFFVDKDYEWGFSQVRLGTGKNDLSPFLPETFKKSELEVYFNNKAVILTNKYSASASEILSISLKELPNITIMGDTTFGANGPISSVKEFTGNFTLPNNWEMQLAQRKTFDKNKKNFEGTGFPPDVVVKQDVVKAQNNIDNQLDAAIEYLK